MLTRAAEESMADQRTGTGSRTRIPLATLVGVAALALALTTVLWMRTAKLTPADPDFSLPGDQHMYIHMATEGPFGFHVAPFCWRPLVPLVAQALPGSLEAGFEVQSFAAMWLAGVVIFLVGRRSGFPSTLALAGMLMFFSLGWATKFNLYDFWLTDAVALLFVALAVYLAMTRRNVAFAVVLAIGVLAKESVIFAAPLAYTLRARSLADRRAARALLLAIPAAAVLAAIRIGIPSWNADPAYVGSLPALVQRGAHAVPSYDLWTVVGRTVARRDWPATAIRVLSSFGLVVGVAPLLAARRSLGLAARFLPMLLLALSQVLVALNTERLVVVAFPAMIVLAVRGCRSLVGIGGGNGIPALALAGSSFGLLLIGPHQWMPDVSLQLVVAAVVVGATVRGIRPGPARPGAREILGHVPQTGTAIIGDRTPATVPTHEHDRPRREATTT
jgi:hypothetical protein